MRSGRFTQLECLSVGGLINVSVPFCFNFYGSFAFKNNSLQMKKYSAWANGHSINLYLFRQ